MSRENFHTGRDWGDNEPLFGGFNNDNHRSVHPFWPLMRDRRGKMSIGSFGSAHSAGVNFVMCDGSVQLVPYTIDARVYRNLENRRDGNVMAAWKLAGSRLAALRITLASAFTSSAQLTYSRDHLRHGMPAQDRWACG